MLVFMVLMSVFLSFGKFIGSVIVNKESLSEITTDTLVILMYCLLLTLATWAAYGE